MGEREGESGVGSASPSVSGHHQQPAYLIQSVEWCTAKITKRPTVRVTTPSEMSSAFPLRTWLASYDKASSNLACGKSRRTEGTG